MLPTLLQVLAEQGRLAVLQAEQTVALRQQGRVPRDRRQLHRPPVGRRHRVNPQRVAQLLVPILPLAHPLPDQQDQAPRAAPQRVAVALVPEALAPVLQVPPRVVAQDQVLQEAAQVVRAVQIHQRVKVSNIL